MKTKIAAVVVIALCCIRDVYAQDEFKIRAAPLRVTHRSAVFKKILSEPINDIITGPKFAVFKSNRKLWVKFPGRDITLLSELVSLPNNFDWYEAVCIAEDRVVASVGNYSEEQYLEEKDKTAGEFRGGSAAVGLLIVDLMLRTCRLIQDIRIVDRPSNTYAAPPDPNSSIPSFQSAYFDGKELYAGAYGYLYKLNLDSGEAWILQEDGLSDNRFWTFKESGAIWTTTDSGGDGASIRKTQNKVSKDYYLLNNAYISPDRVIRFGKRLLTSSSAGIIEIDELTKTYIHYQFSRDKEKMGVFKLSVLNGSLWGVRDDGIARFDLQRKSAIHYLMSADNKLVAALALGVFDGKLYAGTENGLVIVDIAAR
ncbi:MAG TPA: hypothetical protein VFY40_17550 [Blastocatellia bacterium]|nr:hypothetical protein [Blastocatellia bacterium]